MKTETIPPSWLVRTFMRPLTNLLGIRQFLVLALAGPDQGGRS